MRRRTHSISCVLNLLPLAAEIPENVCANILGLQRYAMGVLKTPASVLQRLRAGQQASTSRVRRRVLVRVRVITSGEATGAGKQV